MTDLVRQEILTQAKRVVVKVGTRVLTGSEGRLDVDRVAALSGQLQALRAAGKQVVLVSSGAVGSGMGRLGLTARPQDLATLQAVAAVGQCMLVQAYDQALAPFGSYAAQVLLTADDLNHRTKYLNARNTLLAALRLGATPIINENDTISTEELATTFGDNDRLAALVSTLLQAELLILLSDVAGLYDRDPSDPEAAIVPTVSRIDDAIWGLVRDKKSGLSKGGMASKLEAARIVTTSGGSCIIASGKEPAVLQRILACHSEGTLFLPQGGGVVSRKVWLGFSSKPLGKLLLDDGACKAVCERGSSLLAAGIQDVQGSFERGDVVSLCDAQHKEIGRGLTNYTSDELLQIKGLRSDRIQQVLGACPYGEAIHRDNLMVTGSPKSSAT